MYDPRDGFFDGGTDLGDAATYRDTFGQFPRRLPPAAWRSKAFADLEDDRIWTRAPVAIGLAGQIPGPGDILPYTVGDHGVHAVRLDDGRIEARFNKAQHGGCRMVPAQCRTGAKTRCSFTSCGYSLDRDIIGAAEMAADRNVEQQYRGLRPERLLPVRLDAWGPYLFARLDPEAAPGPADFPAFPDGWPASGVVRSLPFGPQVGANWKAAARAHFLGRAARPFGSTGPAAPRGAASPAAGDLPALRWLFPNLLVFARADALVSVIVQPTALDRCRLRIAAVAKTAASADAALTALAPTLEAAAHAAAADQATLGQWGTPSAPATRGLPMARERCDAGAIFQDWLVARITTPRPIETAAAAAG